jgi:reactive chlorine resistance protein C
MITDARIQVLSTAGVRILRYGLAFLLVAGGAAKFTMFEAEAIRPLVENSPFMGRLYNVFGLRGTSALIGVVEIAIGLLMAARKWLPRASGYASLAAAGMFVVTLSFLFTTPGVFEPTSPWGGFIMKDVILLGAALFTSGSVSRAG